MQCKNEPKKGDLESRRHEEKRKEASHEAQGQRSLPTIRSARNYWPEAAALDRGDVEGEELEAAWPGAPGAK